MIQYFILWIFIILLFFPACTNKNVSYEQEAIHILKFESSPIDGIKDLFEYEFLLLKEDPEHLIGMISKIELFEDKIYILDNMKSQKLFVFDTVGSFITTVGKRGGGPEEYEMITNFRIDTEKRQIMLSDKVRKKLYYFDIDSHQYLFTKDIPFGFDDAAFLPGGNFGWFCHSGILPSKERDYLLITDSLLNPLSSHFYAFFKPFITNSISVGNIYNIDNKTFVFNPLHDIIYQLDKEQLIPYYKLIFNDFRFADIEFLKKHNTGYQNYAHALDKSTFLSGYGVYENNEVLFIPYLVNLEFYMALYDKINNQLYNHTFSELVKELGMGCMVYPKGVSGNKFIGYILTDKENNIMHPQLHEIMTSPEYEEGSHILGFFHLKHP